MTDSGQPSDPGAPPDPAPQPPPKKKPPAAAWWIVGLVGLVLCGGCIAGAVAIFSGAGDDDPVADDNSAAAEIMCEGFIADRLRAPATAEFPAPETRKAGREYTVVGAVDSENGFGAMIRTGYVCTVRDEDDDSWTLVDLQLDE
jgi:hypothetical protein